MNASSTPRGSAGDTEHRAEVPEANVEPGGAHVEDDGEPGDHEDGGSQREAGPAAPTPHDLDPCLFGRSGHSGHASDFPTGSANVSPLPVGTGSDLEHRFGLDLDRDLLADEHAAALEHLVPGEPEVFAVDLRRRREPTPGVSPWVGNGALECDLKLYGLGDVANRELAVDVEVPGRYGVTRVLR